MFIPVSLKDKLLKRTISFQRTDVLHREMLIAREVVPDQSYA